MKSGRSIDDILEKCIDIRLFGGTFAIKKDKSKSKEKKSSEEETEQEGGEVRSITGPVQFKFGRSLHRVKVEYVRGTTVMPSEEGKTQGTMTEMFLVPYALIVFYGIANENAAKDTKLKDEDIDNMLKALWIGHKASTDVISCSKFGHEPRLLIEVIYKENTLTHMGELDKLVRILTEKKDEEIRDIEDVEIDISKLKEKVERYKHKIEKVRYIIGDRIKLKQKLEEVFDGIECHEFEWAEEL